MAQWVEHVNIAHIFLSSALLVRIPYATFIIVTIEKTVVLFLLNFPLLQYHFSNINKFDLFDVNSILSSDL